MNTLHCKQNMHIYICHKIQNVLDESAKMKKKIQYSFTKCENLRKEKQNLE